MDTYSIMGFKQVILADMKTKKHKQNIITDLNKYNETVAKIKYVCELVGKEGQQVKPYFEVDKEVDSDDTSYDYDVDILEKKIIIQNLFNLGKYVSPSILLWIFVKYILSANLRPSLYI